MLFSKGMEFPQVACFADGGGAADEGAGNESVNDNKDVPVDGVNADISEEERFDKDAVNKIVQDRLKKDREKHKEEIQTLKEQMAQKIVEERKEAEELAKLSNEERVKVEKEKEEMKLGKEREKLNEERAQFERERLLLQAEKELSSKKLPVDAAVWVLGKDAEETFERISQFEEKFREWVQADVQEALKGKTPRMGGKTLSEVEQLEKQLEDESVDLVTKVSVKNRLYALKNKE